MYRDWINLNPVQKTFNIFRTRFATEYQIQNEIQNATAQKQGFAANVEVEDPDLTSAVANFAQALAADRSAFTELTDTNAFLNQLMSAIAAQNETLQQQLAEMQQQMNAVNLVQQAQGPPPYVPPQQRAPQYPAAVQHYQPPAAPA